MINQESMPAHRPHHRWPAPPASAPFLATSRKGISPLTNWSFAIWLMRIFRLGCFLSVFFIYIYIYTLYTYIHIIYIYIHYIYIYIHSLIILMPSAVVKHGKKWGVVGMSLNVMFLYIKWQYWGIKGNIERIIWDIYSYNGIYKTSWWNLGKGGSH